MKAFTEIERLLLVVPPLNDADYLNVKKFAIELENANQQINIEFVIWNGDKKITQKKQYTRKQDELIDKDFTFFGKIKNTLIQKKLYAKSDALIVLEENLPNKVIKLLNTSNAELKIAFGNSRVKTNILFTVSSQQLTDKLDVLQNYLVQRMWKQNEIQVRYE